MRCRVVKVTCCPPLQSCSVGRYEAGLSRLPWVSHSHLEWAARDVAAIELHIDEVKAVLPGNETDGIFVWWRDVFREGSGPI